MVVAGLHVFMSINSTVAREYRSKAASIGKYGGLCMICAEDTTQAQKFIKSCSQRPKLARVKN